MTGDFSLAVHALVFLNHKQTTVSSEELANNICTHPARVRKIMSQLKRAQIVETKEGRFGGGYLFVMEASNVTLSMVADTLKTTFVSADWKSGSVDKPCLIASGMANVMDEIYGNLNELCYQQLSQITIADIDGRIFDTKA